MGDSPIPDAKLSQVCIANLAKREGPKSKSPTLHLTRGWISSLGLFEEIMKAQ